MKKVLKILSIIIGIVVLLFVLLISYLAYEDAQRRAQDDKVQMTVTYDAKNCSQEFPLGITVQNDADKAVARIDFDITVRQKGHSTDLNDYLDYEWDLITPKGEAKGQCYLYKLKSEYKNFDDPGNLEFEIGYKWVRFE